MQTTTEKIDKNKCPLFFNMYGFSYGMPLDTDEEIEYEHSKEIKKIDHKDPTDKNN